MNRRAWLAVCVMACVPTWLLADHCPEDKIAAGDPEETLAGVNVDHDSIESVLKTLGTPAKREQGGGPDYPDGSGWARYTWTRPHATITVSTEYYTAENGARIEGLEVVQVAGDPAGQVSGTGRGLKLGDGLPRVTMFYGAAYVDGTVNGPKLAKRTITYCFSDETELSIGLNEAGLVVAMRLVPSVE